jgi:hypothetical protein
MFAELLYGSIFSFALSTACSFEAPPLASTPLSPPQTDDLLVATAP